MKSKIYQQFILLFSTLFIATSVFATKIEITSSADNGPGSLRDAVSIAESGDTLIFDEATSASMINLSSGVIALDKDLVISSINFTKVQINANSTSRIFRITNGSTVSLWGVILMNGSSVDNGGAIMIEPSSSLNLYSSSINNSAAAGDMATNGGGAIYNGGSLFISGNSTFTNNQATGTSGSGGAIFNGPEAYLLVQNCTFTGNSANRAGGAIEDQSNVPANAPNYVENCTFTDNTTGAAPGNGGAIHISGTGSMNINNSTATGNVAASEGGAYWNNLGRMYVSGGSINGNDAQGAGADNGGGALFNNGGSLTATGVTINQNSASGASGSGGGVINVDGGKLIIENCTLTGNTANRAGGAVEDASGADGSFALRGSTLSGNDAGTAPGNGGAVHVTGPGLVSVATSTISNNTAVEGGGLWNHTGTMNVVGCDINGNVATGDDLTKGGGGIFNLSGGTLVVSGNTMFTDNQATGTSGSGGAILNREGSIFRISNSTFTGNSANRAGGAIEDQSNVPANAPNYVENCTFTDNTTGAAPGNGGAIHISGTGSMNINNSTATGNVAASEGGAYWNNLGRMYVSGGSINGNDAQGEAADNGGGGVFNNGGTLTLSTVTVSNNTATGTAGSGGGALNVNGGTLNVFGSTLTGNTSNRAGGAIEDASGADGGLFVASSTFDSNITSSAPGNGGAIHMTGEGYSNIKESTATNNTASAEGGGYWNGTGIMVILGGSVNDNIASGNDADNGGGGLFNNGGTMVAIDVEVIGNVANGTAGSGGGLFSTDGSVTLIRSTLNDNAANRAGGAIEIINGELTINNSSADGNDVDGTAGTAAPGNGGGLHVTGNEATVNIMRSTFSNNDAANEGGGLWNQTGSTMNVSVSTVSGNDGGGQAGGLFNKGIMNVTASTIANNFSDVGAGYDDGDASAVVTVSSSIFENDEDFANTSGGSFVSAGYNVVSSEVPVFFTPLATDQFDTDANLDELSDNGGFSMTHAIGENSPAIGAGDPALTMNDQRNNPVLGAREAGAYENQTVSFQANKPLENTDQNLVFTADISPNPNPGDMVKVSMTNENSDIQTVRVIDFSGNSYLRQIIKNGETINVSCLENGVYILQIIDDKQIVTKKLIIE